MVMLLSITPAGLVGGKTCRVAGHWLTLLSVSPRRFCRRAEKKAPTWDTDMIHELDAQKEPKVDKWSLSVRTLKPLFSISVLAGAVHSCEKTFVISD